MPQLIYLLYPLIHFSGFYPYLLNFVDITIDFGHRDFFIPEVGYSHAPACGVCYLYLLGEDQRS